MCRDRRQDGAAYPDTGRMLRAGASRRIEAPETREQACLANRIRRRPSQGLRYYADQPIPRPNSSSPHRGCG